jgi:hypothetical protein
VSLRHSAGTFPAIIYFERILPDAKGYHRVIVAPDTSHPTPSGYERKECRTLREQDRLTDRLNSQDREMFADLTARDRQVMSAKRAHTRSVLQARMLQSGCTEFERAFIKGALLHLDLKEMEQSRFTVNGYFYAREFDGPDPSKQGMGTIKPPKLSDKLAGALSR